MTNDVLVNSVAAVSDMRINGERLWDSLMELAEIGATAKGAVDGWR